MLKCEAVSIGTDFLLEVITKSGNGSPQVIENFTCKETSKVFNGEYSAGNFRATSSHGH